MQEKLLEVKNLRTYFHTFKGIVKAVDGISFSLGKGEILGIVGESGSGKSVTCFSVLKLIEEPGVVQADEIRFQGKDITLASEKDRKMTILLIPFMSCSAKLPIYALFTAAFFESHQALVMVGLYLIGILMGILVGFLFKHSLFKGNPVPFVMELAS